MEVAAPEMEATEVLKVAETTEPLEEVESADAAVAAEAAAKTMGVAGKVVASMAAAMVGADIAEVDPIFKNDAGRVTR